MRTAVTSWLSALVRRRPTPKVSATKNPPATEVFLVRAMKTLMSGGMTVRIACGRTTLRRVCGNVSPSDRAASACPTPTLLTPERTASQTKAAV